MVERSPAPVVYIDANPFIYAIEGDPAVANPIRDLFMLFREKPGTATTSELALAEVLPKANFPRLQRQYLNLIVWSKNFELQPTTRSILLETVRYRRFMATGRPRKPRVMPKLPDAIHVVTAIQTRCHFFLSNDNGLKLPVHLKLVVPDRGGISNLRRNLE